MNTIPQRVLSEKEKGVLLLSMIGILTALSAPLAIINRLPSYRGYYLFEWLVPNNTVGYLIALTIVAACVLLPPRLPWWRMCIMGAGAGATGGVLAGILYLVMYGKNLTSLNILFLALSGAFPGVVIPAVHRSWLAGRRLHLLHYVGAALAAGSIITLLAAVFFLLKGVWKFSPAVLDMITRQLWLVPTVFSIIAMIALFVGDEVQSLLARVIPSGTAGSRA